MKIQGPNWAGRVNPYNKAHGKDPASSADNKKKDELQISSEAKALLDQISGSQDVERKQKVDEIKQQLSAGNYKVDEEKLAGKLMDWFKL